MPRARASVVWLRMDNRENSENPDECKFLKHVDAMHLMTWQDATRKQMTRQQQRNTGRHLAQRSRGITTLYHYERISSRDLEWHQRENGRDKEEVKLSCFFDKRVKPKNLEKVKPLREKNTKKMNKVRHSIGKRNKEEQIRKTLRLEQGREEIKMI